MDQRVERLVGLLEGSLPAGGTESFTDLARSVNLSTSRARHLFKTGLGIAPTHYIRMRKMREAKYLLETTFLTVKEIASRIGLGDQSHFVRDFKRIYGSPPAKYRALQRAATARTPDIVLIFWTVALEFGVAAA